MKAQHAATLVVPLEEPVSRLNMDFEPLDALALELEAHALRARYRTVSIHRGAMAGIASLPITPCSSLGSRV
eukprot:3941658-Rhodomonas_salina.1